LVQVLDFSMPNFCPRLVSHEFKNVLDQTSKVLTMMSDSSYCTTETESNASFGAVNFDSKL
jgi:purine nucleoside permease